ncbi:E492 group microcin [Xenorhabdus anantnagensis]|uniref:Microcin n=1 Tax=Xenorhabdus anantnagensis TaxID=3025875 RepID=A0ABT5LVR3_9GAMM|nr:microcin [Xenorhabdus anantnagensis]MDC9597169.1 microcin [Xenorhabdus anantnagensis]
MKDLSQNELSFISGAGDAVDEANKKLMKDLSESIALGAGVGAITGGGPGAIVGGTGAAVKTIIKESINHFPVNVPIPNLPMSPSWTRPPQKIKSY